MFAIKQQQVEWTQDHTLPGDMVYRKQKSPVSKSCRTFQANFLHVFSLYRKLGEAGKLHIYEGA
jgi:hypothetical protein